MGVFPSETNLGPQDLTIHFSDEFGQISDVKILKYTIYNSIGDKVSGKSLNASKFGVGYYYAPWKTLEKSGTYRIDWEIYDCNCSIQKIISNYFYVSNKRNPGCCDPLKDQDFQNPKSKIFLAPNWLGKDDLFIKFSFNDFPKDPYYVSWYITDMNGKILSYRNQGTRQGQGYYYAQYSAFCAGNYKIIWEFQNDEDSPLESSSQSFSVLSSCGPIHFSYLDACYSQQSVCNNLEIDSCSYQDTCCSEQIDMSTRTPCSNQLPPHIQVSPPCPPVSCCSFSISRVVHLPVGPLPNNGVFTDQNKYQIPTGITKITFYLSYKRGAPNGYAKLKLLWGNGVEETQETVIDISIDQSPGPYVTQPLYLQDIQCPIPTDDLTINFMIHASIPGSSKTVRLLAAEQGIPGIPGILGITLTASSS